MAKTRMGYFPREGPAAHNPRELNRELGWIRVVHSARTPTPNVTGGGFDIVQGGFLTANTSLLLWGFLIPEEYLRVHRRGMSHAYMPRIQRKRQ